MPLVLDVLTHLDERSAAETSRQLKRQFEEGGRESGEVFGSNLAEGVLAGFHGGEFESIGGIFESAGIAGKAISSGEAIGIAFAGGITAAAGAALVDLGLKVGETFEGINRQIELHTAASGQALQELKSHADALVGSLDSSADSLGADYGTLTTRLQLTSDQADQLTRHVEMLRDRFGDINVGALSGAFRNLNVTGDQADGTLASLVNTSKRYAVALPDLITNLAGFSATFQQLHLSAEQSGNILGEVEANGVPAARAITGLEAAMKTAKDQGQDFTTFVRRAAESIEYYQKTGNEAAAQAISVDVFGTRKWAEADTAARAYLDTVRQSPQAFAGNGAQLDELQKNTRNLHNEWEEVQNKIKAALAPVALNVVDDVSKKMDSFIGWLNTHQQDLEKFFSSAISVVETVVEDVGKLATVLGQHPQLVRDVAIAFGTWEAIKGVNAVLTSLDTLKAWLVAAPAEAETAGAAMTAMGAESAAGGATAAAGLAPVTAELTTITTEAPAAGAAIAAAGATAEAGLGGLAALLGTIAADVITIGGTLAAPLLTGGDAPGSTKDNANDKQIAGNRYFKEKGRMPDGYQQWLQGSGPMPKDLGPYYHPGEKPGGGNKPGPAAAPAGPSGISDVGGRAGPSLPGSSMAPDPDQTGGGPPSDLLTPADLDPHRGKKGPRLPQAPELPMPAGYGAAPRAGETAGMYDAEQRVLEQRHGVDEAQARVNQLEHDNNATADDIQKARNELIKAQKDQNSAELQLYAEQTRGLEKHGKEMGELGAKIDKDFGVSKGLAGIADNLTKFVANLAMAPVLGALNQMVEQSGVRQNAPGAGGLIGMAAVSGAFGPQFMGAGGAGGMPQGPFGGYPGARRGGGGFGAVGYSSPGMPSISSAADIAAAGPGVAALYQFAESMEGTPYSMQLRNDCSGMVSRIASAAVGLGDPNAAQRFSTANEGEWLAAHGFQSGMGGPNDLNIGWHIGGPAGGHTAATLPGGVNAEQGGSNPAFTLGAGAAGAASPQFEYHAHLPMGALQGPGATPGPPMVTDASGAVVSGAPAGSSLTDPGLTGGPLNTSGLPGYRNVPSGFRPKGTDTIPAMLSPGEEVAQASAVRRYGSGTYEAMNKGLVDPTSIRYLSGGSDGPEGEQGSAEATHIGGAPPSSGVGSGMPGGSGEAMGAAASAIGGHAPSAGMGAGASAPMGGFAAGAGAGAASMGIGLAAQIAMQEAQRAIQYSGQLAGIGWQALTQTFLPTGASELAQNSWLTRIGGALMGAQPQIPNMAGKSQNKSAEGVRGVPAGQPGAEMAMPVGTPTPSSVARDARPAAATPPDAGTGAASADGASYNHTGVHIENYYGNQGEDSAGRDIARHQMNYESVAPPRGTTPWG